MFTERLPLRAAAASTPEAGCDRAEAALAVLHGEAAARGLWPLLCRCARSLLRSGAVPACDAACPRLRPISVQCGALLYQVARLSDVRLAVLLGAGDPAAAIWLACALRANRRHAGDRGIIACEPQPELARQARQQLRLAGVSRYVDLHEGAPQPVLHGIDQPLDCLVLTAYPSLMLEVLRQLQARLRPGAVVLAMQPAAPAYLDYVRQPGGPFTSISLPYREGVELSVRN